MISREPGRYEKFSLSPSYPDHVTVSKVPMSLALHARVVSVFFFTSMCVTSTSGIKPSKYQISYSLGGVVATITSPVQLTGVRFPDVVYLPELTLETYLLTNFCIDISIPKNLLNVSRTVVVSDSADPVDTVEVLLHV